MTAEYLVAAQDTAAGGDWFDAIPLGDRLVLIVGDVVGHGVEAAAVMSQLRTALRMQILAGYPIAEALEAVDRFHKHVPGSSSATMCVGSLDFGSGEFSYCTAGHPPPLLVTADATARYVEPSGAGPLGSGTGFPVRTEFLDVGDSILLYTDGLIERPGRPLGASTAEFRRPGRQHRLRSGRLRHRIVGANGRPALRGDAGAAAALDRLQRRRDSACGATPHTATPLNLTLDATIHAARTVRTRLRQWLSDVGADADDISDIVHAISEFVENAVEHGYATEVPDGVVVEAMLAGDGNLHASVIDRGRWKDHREGETGRGRGLAMAEALVSEAHVSHGPEDDRQCDAPPFAPGQLRRRLTGQPGRRPRGAQRRIRLHGHRAGPHRRQRRRRLNTASTLDRQIAVESRSGVAPLTVDLSAVTHLGSAGVSALAAARERALRQGSDYVLVAPPGSPAHHVLSLVQIPVVSGLAENVVAEG